MNLQHQKILTTSFIIVFGVSLFLFFLNDLNSRLPENFTLTEKVSLDSDKQIPDEDVKSPVFDEVIISSSASSSMSKSVASSSTSSTAVIENKTTSTSSAPTSKYKDGVYSTSLSYGVPRGGSEPMTVKLTLKGDLITSATTTFIPDNAESKRYQDRFLSAYKSSVENSRIDSVNLSRVGGASLTSRAFNEAVKEIKTQAKL